MAHNQQRKIFEEKKSQLHQLKFIPSVINTGHTEKSFSKVSPHKENIFINLGLLLLIFSTVFYLFLNPAFIFLTAVGAILAFIGYIFDQSKIENKNEDTPKDKKLVIENVLADIKKVDLNSKFFTEKAPHLKKSA